MLRILKQLYPTDPLIEDIQISCGWCASATLIGLCLLFSQAANSATLVSNLEEPPGFFSPVGVQDTPIPPEQHHALANAFTTGAHVGGYVLNSATIRWTGIITGAPTNLVVAIYSDSNGRPGTQLESLAGPPPPGGMNTDISYSSTGLALLANTTYHIWLNADPPPHENELEPPPNFLGFHTYNVIDSLSDSQESSAGWTIADAASWSQNNGVTWSDSVQSRVIQFSIQATAVPEPRAGIILAGAAMVGFSFFRRWKQRKN